MAASLSLAADSFRKRPTPSQLYIYYPHVRSLRRLYYPSPSLFRSIRASFSLSRSVHTRLRQTRARVSLPLVLSLSVGRRGSEQRTPSQRRDRISSPFSLVSRNRATALLSVRACARAFLWEYFTNCATALYSAAEVSSTRRITEREREGDIGPICRESNADVSYKS